MKYLHQCYFVVPHYVRDDLQINKTLIPMSTRNLLFTITAFYAFGAISIFNKLS